MGAFCLHSLTKIVKLWIIRIPKLFLLLRSSFEKTSTFSISMYKEVIKKRLISFLSLSFSHLAKGIGCYRDTGRRAIATLEGRSRLLKGSYRRRRNAIKKCALAAYKRGYRMFAIQHGGWCASARRAHLTYRRYGKSNRCRNGKGGPWANDVYVLRGMKPNIPLSGCLKPLYQSEAECTTIHMKMSLICM